MTLKADIQTLEPGAIIELWELDAREIGGGLVRFQGRNDGVVIWQGVEYAAWPIKSEGFAITSDQQPSPRLIVGNVDGRITALCLTYEDLLGAIVTRRRTLKKYLDQENFPAGPEMAIGGQFDAPGPPPNWVINAGTVQFFGDGKMRIGRPTSASAVTFVVPTDLNVRYDLGMLVDPDGIGANIRAGSIQNGADLGFQSIGPGVGDGFTFTGTGNPVFVQVFVIATPTQAVVDGVFLHKSGGNPSADPSQEWPPEKWFIERKSAESRDAVEFELSSALDFQGVKLPRRQIIANQCAFKYRQAGCAYIGPPVADRNNVPTSDPLLDDCSLMYKGCKMRQWPDGILNYGGFPAAGLVRT